MSKVLEFFFSSRRRHTRFDCDWSSDVCSSDLFVRAPEAHSANVRARLVSRNLAAGEEYLLQKRTSAALAAFGRALALDPQNAQARGRVDRIRRRDRLLKFLRGGVIGLVLAAVVIAVVWQLHRAKERELARAAA